MHKYSKEKDPVSKFYSSLFVIYNSEHILKNKNIKLDENLIASIRNDTRFNADTACSSILKFICGDLGPPEMKSEKIEQKKKYLMTKIITTANKQKLFVYDPTNKHNLLINLDSIMNSINKFHAIDPVTGYVFIYNNDGKIFVLTASISGRWKSVKGDKERKICTLLTNDNRIDPSLHIMNLPNGSCILFVIGGYEKNNKSIVFKKNILIFHLDFQSQKISFGPSLRIMLRYPRIKPLVFSFKKNDGESAQDRLFILGGYFPKQNKDLFFCTKIIHETLTTCETIGLRTLESLLYKSLIATNNVDHGSIDHTFQIIFPPQLIKKISWLHSAAILKLKLLKKTQKTPFILGIGPQGKNIWRIEYIDEKGATIHIFDGNINLPADDYWNTMIRVREGKVWIVKEGEEVRVVSLDTKMMEGGGRRNKCGCVMF